VTKGRLALAAVKLFNSRAQQTHYRGCAAIRRRVSAATEFFGEIRDVISTFCSGANEKRVAPKSAHVRSRDDHLYVAFLVFLCRSFATAGFDIHKAGPSCRPLFHNFTGVEESVDELINVGDGGPRSRPLSDAAGGS